ncbi:hypothetical protein YC2023_041825 [Brassica napus]
MQSEGDTWDSAMTRISQWKSSQTNEKSTAKPSKLLLFYPCPKPALGFPETAYSKISSP